MFVVWTDIQSVQHLNLQFMSTGQVALYRGGFNGVQLQVSGNTIPAIAAWHSLEFKVTLSSTVGECIIKIDGTEFINYTGNTRNGGTTTRIDGIGIRSKMGQNRWDDLVIFDTLGTVNNSWPGEIVVVGSGRMPMVRTATCWARTGTRSTTTSRLTRWGTPGR